MQPKKQIKKRRKEYIGQFYRGNRFLFVFTLILDSLDSGLIIILAFVMKLVTDFLTGESGYTGIRTALWIGALFGVYTVAFLGRAVVDPLFFKKAVCQYREYVFRKITEKNISAFNRENTGRYISVLTKDVDTVRDRYLTVTCMLIKSITISTAALLIMLYFNITMTAIAVLFSMIPFGVTLVFGKKFAKIGVGISDQNEAFVSGVKEWLAGFPVIKSFKAEREVNAFFAKDNRKLEELQCSNDRLQIRLEGGLTLAGHMSKVGLYLAGAFLIMRGANLSVGTVLAFGSLYAAVGHSLMEVPQLINHRRVAFAIVDKMAELLAESGERKGVSVPAKLSRGIALENVSFAYEEGNDVLRGVTQTFRTGKCYAVVGESGSGKSTLLSLLMGGEGDYRGKILLDGTELREIAPDSLYDLMTLVQQNVFVFDDTLKNNITMFREFDEELVQKAIRQSGLSGVIGQHGGDYLCGENGNGLSGGEKQRVSIARALLRGTDVLLLDEATAALDANTSFEVTGTILGLRELTRIIVTHRLEENVLTRCDEIIVMNRGQIGERGSFHELMEKKGLFYSMFTLAQKSDPEI